MVVMRMVFRAAQAVNSATIVNHISGVRNVGTIRLIHRSPCNFAGKLDNSTINCSDKIFVAQNAYTLTNTNGLR